MLIIACAMGKGKQLAAAKNRAISPIVPHTPHHPRTNMTRRTNYITTKLVLAFFTLIPLWPLLFLLFSQGPHGKDATTNFFADVDPAVIIPYLITSLKMVFATGLLAVAIGTVLAWWFEFFSFPGKKVLSWLVLLPFALPPYISAMVYIEQLSPDGWLGRGLGGLLRAVGLTNPRDERLAVVVLAMAFYPYVYLLARSFLSSSRGVATQVEMARVLGLSPAQCFWRLFLPMMIPQMMAGFILVGLEVMADYGAMNFFAVKTLSMGMFDLWLNLGQIAYARYFCLVVLLWVVLFLTIDYAIQGFYIDGWRLKRKTATGNVMGKTSGDSYRRPIEPSPLARFFILLFLYSLLFFSFGLPLLSLLAWWFEPLARVLPSSLSPSLLPWGESSITKTVVEWFATMGQAVPALITSFGFAALASGFVTIIALVIGFGERQLLAMRLAPLGWLRVPLVIGYAMPGVVLALSILIFGLNLLSTFAPTSDATSDGVGNGPVLDNHYYNIIITMLLFYGYVAKFSAGGFAAVSAGYRALSPNIDHAARSLGQSPFFLLPNFFARQPNMGKIGDGRRQLLGGVLGFIHLPLLRPALLTAFLLTFIEVIKELPITLVLRPFGVETLSLRLFTLVSDERVKMAALPALLIILVSSLSIWLTKKHWLRDQS